MCPKALFAGREDMWPEYETALSDAFQRAGISVDLTCDRSDPSSIDYVIYAPNAGLSDFTPYTRLKAVLSLWAGVESFQDNKTMTAPLARMVDSGLSEGMAEWVLTQVMRHHLGNDIYTNGQDGVWRNGVYIPPLARNRTVGILGLGELGTFSAGYLSAVGFNLCGWSRRQKEIDGVDCFSGEDGLKEVLRRSEILVLLLPLTKATENTLNSETLALMPRGAFIINPGRGPLIDDDALLAALDSGQIAHATLDVFRTEPLPPEHPFWSHPKVTVTPHIASETRAETASETIAENIRRGEAGVPFLYLVDRQSGY